MNCSQCGAPLEQGATFCKYCGEPVSEQPQAQAQAPAQAQGGPAPVVINMQTPQQAYVDPNMANMINNGINPAWPVKSKVAAGILAIFFGGIGVHKFYLGKTGMGIVYLLFCWTCIPAVVGLIEGIMYLCQNDHNFQVKNQVRVQ